MSFSFEPGPNASSFFVKMSNLEAALERNVRKAWFPIGKRLKDTANRNILKRPRYGRTYYIRGKNGKRRKHIASLPGESHANRTGNLRRSMGWRVTGKDMDFGYGVTRVKVPYASWVEKGTGRMAARPSLQIAINEVTKDAENYLAFYAISGVDL